MNSTKHILDKINDYFQGISIESHNRLLNKVGFNYISTEPDFLYESLEIIQQNTDLKNKKFLDVGSGIGNMCGVARIFNLISEGIELNPILYNISKQIYSDAKFHNVDIRDFNNYSNYDIIFYYLPFFDIKLQEELKLKIENNIKIGTYIIVTVPENKDERFISINTDTIKNQIWVKIK